MRSTLSTWYRCESHPKPGTRTLLLVRMHVRCVFQTQFQNDPRSGSLNMGAMDVHTRSWGAADSGCENICKNPKKLSRMRIILGFLQIFSQPESASPHERAWKSIAPLLRDPERKSFWNWVWNEYRTLLPTISNVRVLDFGRPPHRYQVEEFTACSNQIV